MRGVEVLDRLENVLAPDVYKRARVLLIEERIKEKFVEKDVRVVWEKLKCVFLGFVCGAERLEESSWFKISEKAVLKMDNNLNCSCYMNFKCSTEMLFLISKRIFWGFQWNESFWKALNSF